MARQEAPARDQPSAALDHLCDVIVGQQEAMADWLGVVLKGEAAKARLLPMWDADPDPATVTPEVPIVLKHLRTARDMLVASLEAEGLAKPVAGGHLVDLSAGAPSDKAKEALAEAWRRSKVAAITLVEMHGGAAQQKRLYEARQRFPAGRPVFVLNPLEGPSTPFQMPAATPAQRPAVLVVDDEPDLLDSLQAYLSQHAPTVDVLTADSGAKGLELLRQHPVALIISDLRMPGMDGIAFLEQARLIKPEARRLLLTAYSGPDVEDRARSKAKVDAVLQKPGALPELLELLKQVEASAQPR